MRYKIFKRKGDGELLTLPHKFTNITRYKYNERQATRTKRFFLGSKDLIKVTACTKCQACNRKIPLPQYPTSAKYIKKKSHVNLFERKHKQNVEIYLYIFRHNIYVSRCNSNIDSVFYWNVSLYFCVLSFYFKPFLKEFQGLILILSSPTLLILMFVIAVV